MAVKTTYRKLVPTVKSKWLNALRSGDFQQGSGVLCHTNSDYDGQVAHCCLGVLAEIKGKLCDNGVKYSPEFTDDDHTKFKEQCKLGPKEKLDNSSAFVPSIWLDPKAQHKLADMNDNGKSFKQIANWIDKHL